MSPIQQMLLGVGAVATKTYVDDVFSTYVYEGNNSTLAINNGLDLATEGGMVWVKNRDHPKDNCIVDTERGIGKRLETNKADAQDVYVTSKNISSFTSTGFTLGVDEGHDEFNKNEDLYASWSFRKAKGFFDVVEFTQASGTPTNQRISHSLGSAPGMIWMKCTSASRDWFCYHRSLGKDKYFKLNSTGAAANATNGWGTSEPDATEFGFNAYEFGLSTGSTYVAYLFAHDNQSYGEDSNQSIIKCGTFNRSGGTTTDVDVGWQPQYVFTTMYEGPSSRGHVDEMRGFYFSENSRFLRANADNIENNTTRKLLPATGFTQGGDTGNYIYMAIRRPDGYVGKPPELGTDVLAMDYGSSSSTIPTFDSGFPVNFALLKRPTAASNFLAQSRLSGDHYLLTNGSQAEVSHSVFISWDSNVGWAKSWDSDRFSWMWKRHAGFDVVCYTGTGSNQAINHSLGRNVEMAWIKRRDGTADWKVYHSGTDSSNPENYNLTLNSTGGRDYSTTRFAAPTSTQFTVKTHATTNGNGNNYIMMLFASVENISKVGYYTGNGNSSGPTVTLGFAPRFILIKCTTGATNWYLFDTMRGLSSGDDKRISPNENAAQDTGEFITPSSTGFQPATSWDQLNGNNEIYTYYAHA